MAGKLLFPAFPQSRALPWILAGTSGAVVAYGLFRGDGPATTVGVVGLAGCLIAFPIARLLLGTPPEDAGPPPDPPEGP